MFYNKIKLLCETNNIALCAVTQKLGLAKGAVTGWKNGAYPTSKTIVLFAKYFNVTTDSLIMDDEPSQ